MDKYKIARRVHLIQGDLSYAICSGDAVKLACANLPYIPTHRLQSLNVAKFEPRIALEGGEEGLDYIKPLIKDAKSWLAADGLLLLEIDANQEFVATDYATEQFPNASIQVIPDLAGHPRILSIQNHEDTHNSL